MLVVIVLLQRAGCDWVDRQCFGDECTHAPVDLVEQPAAWGVERVVEIEDPGLDMVKPDRALGVARLSWEGHARKLAGRTVGDKPPEPARNNRSRAHGSVLVSAGSAAMVGNSI